MCAPPPPAVLTWDDLPALFPAFDDPGRWLALLRRHAALLEAASERVRTTSVDATAAVRRHYAECLEILRMTYSYIGEGPLVDVGSGGGFPGLVIPAVLPELSVTLVEPSRKRAALLEEIAAALGMTNVSVVAERAEDAGRGPLRQSAAVVTARAVAPMSELLEYTAPLCRPGGVLVLAKGSGASEQIAAAGHALQVLSCGRAELLPMRPEVAEHGIVVVVMVEGEVDARYPRRAGMPGKRPL